MINNQQGKFITIEGGEGAGKSTVINYIENYLKQKGVEVLLTREPGGTELSEKIRHMVLHQQYQQDMVPEAELLLVFAARAQHLQQVIIPSLAAGTWVLSDRFTDASYAYQGAGRGICEQRIAVIEDWVQQGLHPDLTLLLDLSIETGFTRIEQRKSLDRIESEQQQFFHKVRECYLSRAKRYPERFRIIDAEQDLVQVQQQVGHMLDDWMVTDDVK